MTEQIQFGDRLIGPGSPTYVIAEAGVNHNGSMQIAKELIDKAADADADAVKFQKRNLTQTYINDIVQDPAIAEMGVEYTVSNLKDVLLTDGQYRKLAQYSGEQGIQFLCSPWDTDSVDFLEDIDIPAYKVGSPDMTNFVLLERLAQTDKPLLLSTGMSEEAEIDQTVKFLQERNVEFGLLHCRSTYPSPFHNLNLEFMTELKARYDLPIGYSGHERGIAVSSGAVAMGASVIERHFTLSRDMEGPDHAASLEPQGLNKLIRDIRNIEQSKGVPQKYMTRGEYNNRVSLAKSLATTRTLRQGEEISREDLTAKSPAKGISPQELYNIVGRKIKEDIGADEILQWNVIEDEIDERFETSLNNWGVVVRFSDITQHDWGNPDFFEFRINGADIDQEYEIEDCQKQLGVHAPEQKGHDIVDLSSPDETRRQEAVETIQKVIDKVRVDIKPHFETDSPPIVIHPGGITEHDSNFGAISKMNDALERSMSELDDNGVQLLLENMPPLPWIYGGQQYHNNFMDADEIADYCERTGQRICYDTSHAKLWCNYANANLYEHAKKLLPYTEYLHVADAAGVDGEGIQIGEGEINFERLMKLYDGFNGPIVTEIWRGHEREGRGFKIAAEKLSMYI